MTECLDALKGLKTINQLADGPELGAATAEQTALVKELTSSFDEFPNEPLAGDAGGGRGPARVSNHLRKDKAGKFIGYTYKKPKPKSRPALDLAFSGGDGAAGGGAGGGDSSVLDAAASPGGSS